MEREKEREVELECAMFTNCLLLGLDPSVLGIGMSNGNPKVGLFRHSNPRMGEYLLHFILSALRGPIQSAKDFDKVWPIFDSAQSRDFRKIVQGIITELESQGALPRSNSRVSSLATCCGPRFVELLWQLSLHALREVHKRSFAADIESNPLPSSLTDVSYSYAASLLPVTKARIALERRKFLKSANSAVQRQATWSSLAHEMTSDFRSLCAEEAYLQQELEKLQDSKNKVKLDGELWDDRVSSSLGNNSHLVSKATRLWDSLLSKKSQHEALASGPIEDLIAHREHRYRISGSSLLASMEQKSFADQTSDWGSTHVNENDKTDEASSDAVTDGQQNCSNSSDSQVTDENISRVGDRSGRNGQGVFVDVSEILRRWTHALQKIHKQSLHLAKVNDGEGPELLRCISDGGVGGHAESLAATVAEHRQHLASIEVLTNQLKEAIPTMQRSISELTEEVNSISSALPTPQYCERQSSPTKVRGSGRASGNEGNEVLEVNSKLSTIKFDKTSASPARKLPSLFSLTPNSSGKTSNSQKRQAVVKKSDPVESLASDKVLNQHSPNRHVNSFEDSYSCVENLRRSVREAALHCNQAESDAGNSVDGSEPFFVSLTESGLSSMGSVTTISSKTRQKLFSSPTGNSELKSSVSDTILSNLGENKCGEMPDLIEESNLMNEYADQRNIVFSKIESKYENAVAHGVFCDFDETQEKIFSPPLLVDAAFLRDSYEDLLAPFSEGDMLP